jgi:hypothetical protein
MGGAGWVRDLRDAMSLGTPQGEALAAKVVQFKNATTRDAVNDGVWRRVA